MKKESGEHTPSRKAPHRSIVAVVILAMIGIGATAFLTYQNLQLKETQNELRQSKLQTQEEALDLQNELQEKVNTLNESLDESEDERERLSEALQEEQDRNEQFAEQIEDITGTVGILDKLANTDEELLQKYSKVYFLNEHYMPEELSQIEDEYVYNEDKEYYLHSDVMSYFEDMVEDAQEDDVNLWVVSAFRSFDEQSALKDHYTVTYGSGANAFSAEQGYSEHQLGTTVDFTTNDLGGGLRGFEETAAYEWLEDNAHEYGFTLSYPEDNSYYIFEPWHWRFVGVELAEHLHDEGVHFYDMSQREIDEYLVSIFD